MDRKVVDVLNGLPERGRYLRGLRAWIGFRQTAVPFEREARYAGKVKYTFRKSFSLADDRYRLFFAGAAPRRDLSRPSRRLFALVMIRRGHLLAPLSPAAPLIGYTIITAVILFLAAVQLLCLGIIGEYLGRVYEEVKGRPIFTLKEVSGDSPAGFSHASATAAGRSR